MARHLLITAAITLVFAGACAKKAPTLKIDKTQSSALAIYPTVEQFAKQKYPEAVFFGYNNTGSSVYRDNRVPNAPDKSGVTSFWFYFFAKNQKNLDDKIISDDDAFGVLFQNGELKLIEAVTARDLSIDEDDAIGKSSYLVDSNDVFDRVLAKLKEEFQKPIDVYHAQFNCTAAMCEITLFTSVSEGYDTKVNPKTGEVFYPRSITIQ